MHKTLLPTACLVLPFAAYAAEAKKPTPQQERMATCSKEASAKTMKRDERSRFMATCLTIKTASASQLAK